MLSFLFCALTYVISSEFSLITFFDGFLPQFHPFHGVVGMKIVEAKDVTVQNVDISDLVNTADEQLWVCKNPWQLQPSGEDIRAVTAAIDSTAGAMIRGVEIVRSEDMSFDKVSIAGLRSEEGPVVGIDIIGDGNDRTDHEDDVVSSFGIVCSCRWVISESLSPHFPHSTGHRIRQGYSSRSLGAGRWNALQVVCHYTCDAHRDYSWQT